MDLSSTVQSLARWDQAETPLEDYLVECRQPRISLVAAPTITTAGPQR
jgi:hypothetical protein